MTRYWIVFKDAEEWYLRWMKRGFRHLWIQGCRDGLWFSIDLRATTLQITADFLVDWSNRPMPETNFELNLDYQSAIDVKIHRWRGQGFTVVDVSPGQGGKFSFFGLLTCVGVAKRFLGIRAPWILTPAQLHRYLTKNPA